MKNLKVLWQIRQIEWVRMKARSSKTTESSTWAKLEDFLILEKMISFVWVFGKIIAKGKSTIPNSARMWKSEILLDSDHFSGDFSLALKHG